MGVGRNVIACRFSSYGEFNARAFEHIAAAGLKHVEIMVPPPDQLETVAAQLAEHGLTASSIHGDCDPKRADIAEQIKEQLPAFEKLGCKLMFVSVNKGEQDAETVYQRLRLAGDAARVGGVTIVMETHPDLITNADVALETMRGVNHPNVRINFDTANLYYYNHEIDCVEQVRKVVDYVAAVHLKDTDGGYHHWHFPALGQGIVDFAGVFSVLDEAGYDGPCTLEVEGIEGEEQTEELVCQRVLDSLTHLRKLNRL